MPVSLLQLLLLLSLGGADPDYDRAPLKELTQYRLEYRKADGILCAAASVQGLQAFTGCSDGPDPDGKVGKPWCYYEAQLHGQYEKTWGYCDEKVNYDLLRSMANEHFQLKVDEVLKMEKRLEAEKDKLDSMMARYNTTCGAQSDAVSARLKKMEPLVGKARGCLDKVDSLLGSISSSKSIIANIHEQVATEKLLASKAPENCAVVAGYEDDAFPDGLIGAYFKNPLFKYEGIERTDESINFMWSGRDPMKGVSNHGFSVRWDGYIEAPFTGEFTFSLESSCGARLFLNEEAIIIDRMPIIKSSLNNEVEIPLLPPSGFDGVKELESKPVTLTAGEKNKIRVEMLHSTHLKWNKSDEASIKLSWSTSGMSKQVVDKAYFYQSNTKSPLKISGLNPAHHEITYLYDGEFAYKDSNTHYIADVPMKYFGLKTIRGLARPTIEHLTFSVNRPATLFLAAPLDNTTPFNPCEGSIKPTDDIVAVYESESRNSQAFSATYMKIYQLELRKPGPITINVMSANTPFISFVRPVKQDEGSCGGALINLSNPSSPVFESCENSSSESGEYACQYGLIGKYVDKPYHTWKSSGGNGVGEFIIVRFKQPVKLFEFHIKPLDDPITWPSEITLSFSEFDESDNQVLTLLHSNNVDYLAYPINPVITKYVKIEVTRMFVNSGDTGGAFQIKGTICNDQTVVTPNINKSSKSGTNLLAIHECHQVIDDLNDIHPITNGKSASFTCPTRCLVNNAEPAASDFVIEKIDGRKIQKLVYGGDPAYTPESQLCHAALHSGVCSENAIKPCDFTVKIVNGQQSYKANLSNGIQSDSHGPSKLSLIFSKFDPPHIYAPEKPFEIYISFGVKEDEDVPGVLLDQGASIEGKDAGEFRFGWENPISNKVEACHEKNAGIEFEGENPWIIELPQNGVYKLDVQIGSPCKPTVNNLACNGVELIENLKLKTADYYWATKDIVVLDKKIILQSSSDQTNIMNIKISRNNTNKIISL